MFFHVSMKPQLLPLYNQTDLFAYVLLSSLGYSEEKTENSAEMVENGDHTEKISEEN